MKKGGYDYVLASRRHGTLYIGVTAHLERRIHDHREGLIPGFTRDHGVTRLVHYEAYDDIETAILREKRLKEWRREWKINLIERDNPEWRDIALDFGAPSKS